MFSAGSVQAAVINWQSSVDIYQGSTSQDFVDTSGTLVLAVSPSDGLTGIATVNGVAFTQVTGSALFTGVTQNGVTVSTSAELPDYDGFGDGSFSSDAAIYNLITSATYGATTVTFSGLTTGQLYMVQIVGNDSRSGRHSDFETGFGDGTQSLTNSLDAGTAGRLSLSNRDPDTGEGEASGDCIIGTFIADAPTQSFEINGSTNGFSSYDGGRAQINGLQLRFLGPAPTLSADSPVSGNFTVDVDFTEDVSGVTESDFSVVNGTVVASSLSGSGDTYSVEISPISVGDVSITLPAGTVAADSNNYPNSQSNTLVTTYVPSGSDQPVPTLTTGESDVYGDYTVNISFSEAVTGLEESDFEVSGGTLSGLEGSGESYTVVVTPNFGGDVTLLLPSNSVTDLDGDTLQNSVSNELVTAYHVIVTVDAPADLLPYLDQDNVQATLTPGTYTIDAADVTGTYGTPRFEFWGSNSTYDFTDVTIDFASDIYTSGLSMSHIQIFGNNNVLKNLTMVDLCEKNLGITGLEGGTNIIMDGQNNRVEGFHMTVSGSYPYGYGDCFGKGGTYTIKHWKHCGLLVRGESNHVLNCTLMQTSYGHCIFMQAASNPTIEGCYVEAETRTTDDILAETSGPAYDIGFITVWEDPNGVRYKLPPGYTKSTSEAGIRAYNGGNTYIDGVWYDRGTSNATILNNTLVNTRTGVTLTHSSGYNYVEGCTTIGTERGYAVGSGDDIVNCSGDAKHGPVFGVDYESNNNITADITVLPYDGDHYNGSRHLAYILGSNHNLTFNGTESNPDQSLEINVGGDKRIESSYYEIDNYIADDIVINNFTGHPLILDDASSDTTGQSCGTVTDEGTNNDVEQVLCVFGENVALNGTATQSSLYSGGGGEPSMAIDDNTSGEWGDSSVTHTANEASPWWQVDLGVPYVIEQIQIYGRTDNCCKDRLSNYDVYILDCNGDVVWSEYQADYPAPSVSLDADGTRGRYVQVQLRDDGDNEALSLAEVRVLSEAPAGYCGDLTGDWQVDLEDVAELSSSWLGDYNMDDLLHIANDWLNELAVDTTITIQEDEAGYCSVDGTVDSDHNGYTGTGFVNTNNALGAGVDWSVDGSAGTYTITWRYAISDDTARPADLIVNGSVVSSDIPFAATGDWTVWTTQTVDVTLSAGVKSFRLEATGSAGLGNIDYMQVTGPDAATADCN